MAGIMFDKKLIKNLIRHCDIGIKDQESKDNVKKSKDAIDCISYIRSKLSEEGIEV